MKKRSFVALLLVGATILGGTVLREPIAYAAQSVSATIVGPLDADGNVRVHEQGTASVTGTVGLSSSANTVKLDSGANGVSVVNPADAPVPTRDADNPARQQYNVMVHFAIPNGQAADSGSFSVPQGKILVITHVSGQAQAPPGQHPLFQLQFASFKHFLRFTLEDSPGPPFRDLWQMSEPLEVIYGPASSIVAELSRDETGGTIDADVTVSGYLVNAQ